MTAKEFDFSLLMDRVVFTLETIEMYRASFEGGNPSMTVVNRMQDLLMQLYNALDACHGALETYQPHLGEVSRFEKIRYDVDDTLLEFQNMIRDITINKLRNLSC